MEHTFLKQIVWVSIFSDIVSYAAVRSKKTTPVTSLSWKLCSMDCVSLTTWSIVDLPFLKPARSLGSRRLMINSK